MSLEWDIHSKNEKGEGKIIHSWVSAPTQICPNFETLGLFKPIIGVETGGVTGTIAPSLFSQNYS